MSPLMEADFNWTEEVQASVPVYEKGDYELTIKKVRGQAWYKPDEHGNPTEVITTVVKARPEMVGVINSEGKLKSEQNKKKIAGSPCEEINFWLTSDGAKRMSKRQLMAVAGYNPDEEEDEAAFNDFVKKSKLDLSFRVEERDDGKLDLIIGDGWGTLLIGKNVRSHMEPETRERSGMDAVTQQNYVRLYPVNM